ncbi:transcriptional regulator with XRE-family HTH domain [Thermocatellispora tengchongensis]|uniref:Transcriptional regulator with XRE-family HTH domain n=1 Tax=Thermocatellispora tengchongensis TaxID=1073253 RepID=A0A840PKL4_9ACTN|nr:helix-turn-helix transcriptional regulator [Thermocatellispora tengchongensis]MBB5137607.1 transcriptional regulator with XRE-family HTH domain [Thermocatellispora tengchongensis]
MTTRQVVAPGRLNQNPKAVRRQRLIAGLSQKALAEKAGVSANHMCNIERGHRSASVEMLHRIATALECDIEGLLAE